MSNDIEELAIKCGAEIEDWEDGQPAPITFYGGMNQLQAYTNEIIEMCAIEAEKEFKHNSYHVADLIRNLKG